MMALAGVELERLVPEPNTLTTRPPPCQCSGCTWQDLRPMYIR